MQLRTRLVVAAATLAVLVSATPASAITNGRPDGNAHPYTALMQTYDENAVPLQVCSGALLSPTVFLTAGHCLAEPHAAHAELWFEEGPILPDIDYLLALFLDPDFTGSCNESPAFDGYPCQGHAGGTPHPHPDFCFECDTGKQKAVVRDVGVVTLDAPVPTGLVGRYARLPSSGLVDGLANKTALDFVGYGVQEQLKLPGKYLHEPTPFYRWAGSGQRMYAPSELITGEFASSDEFIRLSLNATQGSGGVCFGDSGGPDLLGGTDTVVGVNSYVSNANCKGVAYSQRVDVPAVRAWIEAFMP